MSKLLTADWIHHQGTFRRDHALLVDGMGRIAAAGPLEEVQSRPGAATIQHRHLAGCAIAPGTVSAHSHAFQVFLRGAGDHPRGFRDWVTTYLYPLIEALDDDALEAASLLCFTQMLRAGITTVGEFHYLHNGLGDYADRGNDLSRIVIRAARRVGLRVALIRTIYDVHTKSGQGRMAQPVARSVELTRELAQEYADDPGVTVLPAPHSLHGATRAAIEASAALARELDTRWHIHLAEQEEDVPFARGAHGATPLDVLESWSVLDERTVLVHGIWLSEAERALLAERKGALVSNPTTNMALGDGIAALTDLRRRGVPVALGTDMNAAPNVFQEMRIAEYLQRVEALQMGCLPRAGGETPDPEQVFAMGTRHGGQALGLEVGLLEAGQWADLLVIDLEDPSLFPAAGLGGDALLNVLSSAMVPETAIREVHVGGRRVAQDGAPVDLHLDELSSRVRVAQERLSS